MALVFDTQKFIINDGVEGEPPLTDNVILLKDYDVIDMNIITNIIVGSVRHVTVGLLYDDAVQLQHYISFQLLTLNTNTPNQTNVIITNSRTIDHAAIIENSLTTENPYVKQSGQKVFDTISTMYLVTLAHGALGNAFYSTQQLTFDPLNPITTGVPLVGNTPTVPSLIVPQVLLQRSQANGIGDGTIIGSVITVDNV